MPARREPVEIGYKFGMLTIVSEAEDKVNRNGITRQVRVKCECGAEKIMPYNYVNVHKTCGAPKCKWKRQAAIKYPLRQKVLEFENDLEDIKKLDRYINAKIEELHNKTHQFLTKWQR